MIVPDDNDSSLVLLLDVSIRYLFIMKVKYDRILGKKHLISDISKQRWRNLSLNQLSETFLSNFTRQ